jgi:NAD(P)-dependent dehydrogenase (short-subunit alcohol dehydrogenase family)
MRVLITGSSSLISISIRDHLIKSGHEVHLTSGQKDSDHIQFDLKDPESSEAGLDQFLIKGLDAIILCAASPTYKLARVEGINVRAAEDFLKANILGNYWLIQKVLPVFKQQNFGRIIFLSSMCTEHPLKGYSVYAMAKSAIETLMKYVAHEYGKYNITANTIRLGVFHTNRNDKYLSNPAIRKKIEESVSLNRIGNPADINPAIDMLISKDSYIQGTEINIAGGPSMPL